MRNKERISILGDRHITGFGTQGSKGEESIGPRTLDTIKRGRQPTAKGREKR